MKKFTFIITLILSALMLISCTSDSLTEGGNSSDDSEKLIKSRNAMLAYLKSNASLPSLPGDSFESVDTDGFEMSGVGDTFVYTNDTMGMTYTFAGGDTPESSSLTSVKLEKPSYALFGFAVGDTAADADRILTASGFEAEEDGERTVYSKDSVYIALVKTDNEIASIEIYI